MDDTHFVSDGRDRALDGAGDQIDKLAREIRAAVEAEYEERLSEAGPLRRLWLRMAMARKIRARVEEEIEKILPSDGLYSHASRR